ncbi:MAG: right-handed parallel beta-helix repeat-containing protein [Phycisphaerae bacterium]|nr:right-handed parallel beta-helix repeat-containing protein [Phycisphaerae bacterium]
MKCLIQILCALILSLLTSITHADYPEVPFDSNSSFLVYQGYDDDIVSAMDYYGLTYTLRTNDPNNGVTAQDLANHDILIVGWNTGILSEMSGISSTTIEAGITGRVVLTGHDADAHVTYSPNAGNEFFLQTIKYCLDGPGIGMVVFADEGGSYQWLPESWDIQSVSTETEYITDITEAGQISGIYNNLTPALLSNWVISNHNYFTQWSNSFTPYELGGNSINDNDVITLGTPINANGFVFNITDDTDPNYPVSPGDSFTYTINWENTSGLTFSAMIIMDYLPEGVYYEGGDTTNYDFFNNTYRSILGQVLPNASGTIQIPVFVYNNARPLEYQQNTAVLFDGLTTLMTIHQSIPTADWDDIAALEYVSGVIYVDQQATNGFNTGTCWKHAYTDLQDGLWRAKNRLTADPNDIAEIWVAKGNYSPGENSADTFDIPSGCEIYGGFTGKETACSQRCCDKNKVYLDGNNINENTINFTDADNTTIFDGFDITGADQFAIDINNSSPIISHCIVQSNNAGINIDNNSSPTLINNVIAINDQTGISFDVANSNASVRNNTIAYNSVGISANSGSAAISNNIIWYNASQQVSASCTYTYCCVQDPNDPTGDTWPDTNHNITAIPVFLANYDNIDPGSFNYHIDLDLSPCIDLGNNTNIAINEVDIDGHDRIYDSVVDMGADEATCNDYANTVDFDNDVVVNLKDFALLSKAWLSISPQTAIDPDDAINWDQRCDLNVDDYIDIADLALFLDEWLWQACYNIEATAITQESMAFSSMSTTVAETAVLEPSLEEKYIQLADAINWLPQLWENSEEPISQDQLQILYDFEDELNKQLEDIADQLNIKSNNRK